METRTIPGYRVLSDDELSLIDQAKAAKAAILDMIDKLDRYPHSSPFGAVGTVAGRPTLDHRNLAIARTQIEMGFMALVKAIAQPRRIRS